MAKINVLSSNVFNKIAAGEVVQRPASVVKELVENAIDAGATRVEVSVERGGIDNITVSDDGCGIAFEELKVAFLPHATSKISSDEDLAAIQTLGFRGEALASIAAVSMVTLVSKPAEQEFAGKIEISGESSEITESAGGNGTSVSVSNLFYHTPARLKFLKSPRAEEGEISNLVSRLILANPQVSFVYSADGGEIYRSDGKGLEDAMCAVYGREILDNCLKVFYEKNGVCLEGYVGRGGYSKPNRSFQTLVLNGRYVQNQTVSTAVANAYGDFLMKRQYPFYVLALSVQPSDVDVNVHPAKSEVRFADANRIFGVVYKSVFSAIRDVAASAPEASFSEEVFVRPAGDPVPLRREQIQTEMGMSRVEPFRSEEFFSVPEPVAEEKSPVVREDKEEEPPVSKEETRESEKAEDDDAEYEYGERREFDMWIYDAGVDVSRIKIVGTLFHTYIVVEYVEEFYLIDQHAAHERLLFDRFRNNVVNHSVQPLLIPYILTLSPQEEEIFEGLLDDLKRLNFEIEPFGVGSYKVSGIPLVLTGFDIDEFFREVTQDIKVFRNLTDFSMVRDKLAQKACKAAVKAGDELSLNEIRALLSFMKRSTLRCPHGRPIVVKFTKTDVEKWFKRIV